MSLDEDREKERPAHERRDDADWNFDRRDDRAPHGVACDKECAAGEDGKGTERAVPGTEQDPAEVFENALKNVMPTLEVKSKRVGGANYQVPMPVRGERRFMLAARWILTAVRAKKGRPMAIKLSEEIIAASKNEGDAVKKKADVQRMAEANRAFAHFAR